MSSFYCSFLIYEATFLYLCLKKSCTRVHETSYVPYIHLCTYFTSFAHKQAISFIDILLPVVRFRSSRELLNNALRNTLRFVSPIRLLILLVLWASPEGYMPCKTTSIPHKLAGILADVKRNCGVPISKDLKVSSYIHNA